MVYATTTTLMYNKKGIHNNYNPEEVGRPTSKNDFRMTFATEIMTVVLSLPIEVEVLKTTDMHRGVNKLN